VGGLGGGPLGAGRRLNRISLKGIKPPTCSLVKKDLRRQRPDKKNPGFNPSRGGSYLERDYTARGKDEGEKNGTSAKIVGKTVGKRRGSAGGDAAALSTLWYRK